MEHNELTKELATRVAGSFDFETLLQMAYEVLAEDYKECSREGLLQEMEDIKEERKGYCDEVELDDLIKVAEDNVERMLAGYEQKRVCLEKYWARYKNEE